MSIKLTNIGKMNDQDSAVLPSGDEHHTHIQTNFARTIIRFVGVQSGCHVFPSVLGGQLSFVQLSR